MTKTLTLKVADHNFTIEGPEKLFGPRFMTQYQPFAKEEDSSTALFAVRIVDTPANYTVTSPLVDDIEQSEEGMVKVGIHKTTTGLLYDITMPGSTFINAQLHVNPTTHSSMVHIHPENKYHMFFAEGSINNAIILSYISFTIHHSTLLLHSSTVVKNEKAYLFLGKSGTGKSTHSKMWLDAIPECELMNDDHPIVRHFEDGSVIAYGSPWSGKTSCYKDMSAPVAAIVRIKRAPYNKLNKLSIVRSYASITSSCSGMQWDAEMVTAKSRNLEKVITSVGCYEMECLPNKDAAICCFTNIDKTWQS